MTETNPLLDALTANPIRDVAAEREPYKHTVLNEIFNSAFWDPVGGTYAAPRTLEEIEQRFNSVVLSLTALYEVPAPESDGLPCLRTVDAQQSAVQEQLDAFYAPTLTLSEIEDLGTPATSKPNFEQVPEWWPTVREIREGALEQLGAVKVPTGQPGSLKFSLNVPALERLIGGNSELEVELRKSIVQEFAKRHLTSVANEMMDVLKDDMQKTVRDQFNSVALKDVARGWQTYKVLTPEIAREVSSHITELVRTEVDKTLQGHVEAALARVVPSISSKVQSTIDREIVLHVRDKVRDEIKKTLGG